MSKDALATLISLPISVLVGFVVVYFPGIAFIKAYRQWDTASWEAFCANTPLPKRPWRVRLGMTILRIPNPYEIKPPVQVVISPLDADEIKPGDPAWEIFEQALNTGHPVWGTYDPTTGKIIEKSSPPKEEPHE